MAVCTANLSLRVGHPELSSEPQHFGGSTMPDIVDVAWTPYGGAPEDPFGSIPRGRDLPAQVRVSLSHDLINLQPSFEIEQDQLDEAAGLMGLS